MKTPFPASAQCALSRALLLTLASVALWLPANGGAQTAAPSAPSGTPAPPADAGSLEKPSLPPPRSEPANPLVLFNPQDKSGNATQRFDNDGNLIESEKKQNVVAPQDYRRDWDETRTAPGSKSLPLFGYDFFRPAREIIRARRAYLMRAYEMEEIAPLPNHEKAAGERKASEPNAGGNSAAPAGGPAGAPAPANRAQPSQLLGALFDASGDRMSDAGPNAEAMPETRTRGAKRAGKAGQVPDDAGAGPNPGRSGGGGLNVLPLMGEILSDQGAADQGEAEPQSMPRQRAARGRGVPSRQRGYGNPGYGYSDYGYPDYGYSGPEERPDYLSGSGLQPGFSAFPLDANRDVADPLSQLFLNPIASVPPNYQLAPGDVLTISISSPTQDPQSYTRTVDSHGAITLGNLKTVVVRGLTAGGAEKLLQAQLQRLVRNAEVSVTLSQLRTIQITVSGAAFLPGTYTVPANTSAYNVLNAAGGPTFDGTLRNIEVRRSGKIIGKLDLYRFLALGEETSVIPLQTGDMIVIPPRQSQVSVSGEVLHPALFELTPSETLQDALRYAGGVKPSAVDQRIHIKTLVPGTARVITDVDIKDSAAKKTALYDGDAVEVFSVRPLLVNKVSVEGAVDQPSDYELTPGMHVSDLLQRARGLLPEAYLGRADLYRWNPDNTNRLLSIDLEKALAHDPDADVVLTRWDLLKVYTRKEVAWTGRRTVTVRGAVQRAGVYDYSQNMRVRDLLMMAGGPTPDAYMQRAVLLHQNGNGTFDYEYINLDETLKGNREADTAVRDNDVLALYRTNEAHFEPDHFVTIRGEVVAPGIYPRAEGMRASALLALAGGFRPGGGSRVVVAHARRAADDPKTTLLTTNVAFDAQGKCAPQDDVLLEDGDVITVQGTGGFQEKVTLITVKGAVARPGPIVLTDKEMRLSDALKVAGGLRPESFPEGTEFRRDPRLLASAGQKDLALIIGKLNDLLNESERKRLVAKSHVERIKAVGAASQGDASPSVFGGTPVIPNPAAGALVGSIAQDELVSRPRTLGAAELEPNGNIAVNLPEALRHPGGNEDILLMDGDIITVPEQPTTVQVVGAVVNGRGVLFKPGAGLNYYVEQTGGYTVDAAKDRIMIIHAGGGLIPARKIRELRPGDVIVVPTRVLAEKLAGNSNGIDRFFRAITNTAISTLLAVRLFGL